MLKRSVILVVAAAILGLAWMARDMPYDWWQARSGLRPLLAVKSWHYQLDEIDAARLAARPEDLVVMDYAREHGKVPLTAEEVHPIKSRGDGQRRLVVAYLSVGEAEEFRYYWQEAWKTAPPDWLGEENCNWPQAHRVKFWLDGWKDTNYRGPQSYLKRVIDAGFDGVYLDRVDIYETYLKTRPQARDEMIDFVRELGKTARTLKPGFLVIAQNGEDLLDDRSYRRAIDAIAKEDLFFGQHGTQRHNTPESIKSSLGLLRGFLWEWKPVLNVEYLADPALIAAARTESAGHGFVPTFQPRSLDGSDPALAAHDAASEPGTPEHAIKNCPPGTAW